MNKLQQIIMSLVEYDKALHFIIGFFLFVLTSCFLSDIHSLIIVFVVALGKEIRDEFTYRGGDWKDVLFTILPAVTLVLLNLLKINK